MLNVTLIMWYNQDRIILLTRIGYSLGPLKLGGEAIKIFSPRYNWNIVENGVENHQENKQTNKQTKLL
jgi:hypothetical protein